MRLSSDLLEQARHLARRERGRPRQASLRRAVSTAYYAIFHLLLEEAVLRMGTVGPAVLRPFASRTINHSDLKKVAQWFASAGTSPRELGLAPPSFDLRLVADACLELQRRRHDADYDAAARFSRGEVFRLIDDAEQVFQAWRRLRRTEEGKTFLFLLLLTDRWKR